MSQQSFHQQTATGADINFTITTFSSDEIKVYVDGVLKTAGVHYNINPYNSTGQSTVDWIGTAPSSPSVVRVIRQTDVMNNGNTAVEGRATFQAGSSVKAVDLNNNTKQVLRAIKEQQDQLIQTYDIQDDAVKTAKIADSAVTENQIADNAVRTAKIEDGAVTSAKIADATINTQDLATGLITTSKISDNQVTTAKIADSNITTAKLADANVTTAKIANDAITSDKIANDALTGSNMAAGTITTTKIADSNITTDKIADSNVTTAKIANSAVTEDKIATGAVTSAKILVNAVTDGKIAAGAVTANKIQSNSVTTAKIADANVTTDKIADSAVTADKIATDAVTSVKIQVNAVTDGKIAAGAVTTAKIADDAITSDKIANDALTGANMVAGTITSNKLADNAVTTNKINDNAIEFDKFHPDIVVTNSEQASHSVNDTTFFTTAAAEARYFNASTGETIKDGQSFPDNDTTIATTAAINDRIIDLVDDVGGFVPIANETSFPNTNPDVNNGAGTIVSVAAASTSLNPSGTTLTIANGTVGNSTVTITGNATTIPQGFGFLVETTSTLNTYTFHRLVPKATEVTTVAGISGNVTTVAGISSNVTAVANNSSNINSAVSNASNINSAVSNASNINSAVSNASNINSVVGNATNINTVAGSITNVNNVGGSISSVNTAASNLNSINNFGDTYQVASSAPSTDGGGNALAAGDLYFDTSANELRVYNGSTFQGGVTATGNLAGLGANTFTGNQQINGQLEISGVSAVLDFTETNANPDYRIIGAGGFLKVRDTTNSADLFSFEATRVRAFKNFDADAGIDVTGNITTTGDITITSATPIINLTDSNNDSDYQIKNGNGDFNIKDVTNGVNRLTIQSDGQVNIGSMQFYTSNNVAIPVDGAEFKLGAGDDLKLYHSGTASFIQNTTACTLLLQNEGNIQFEAKSGEDSCKMIPHGAVELYYDNSKKFETTSSGIKVFGDASTGTIIQGAFSLRDTTSGSDRIKWIPNSPYALRWSDNFKATFGLGDDLQIYHDGTNSYITNGANGGILYLQAYGENSLKAHPNGQVELYYDGALKAETRSDGFEIKQHLTMGDSDEIRLGNGTDLKIYHNGTNNYLDSSNGHIYLRVNSTENGIKITQNGNVEISYDGTKRLETKSDGARFTGHLYANDNEKIRLGTGHDLEIYHDGTNSVIKNSTGSLFINATSSEVGVKIIPNESVELYENGTLVAETTSGGFNVEGVTYSNGLDMDDNHKILLGTGDDLEIFHDGTNTMIDNDTGDLKISSTGTLRLRGDNVAVQNNNQTETMGYFATNGAAKLYYDNAEKLETTANGVNIESGSPNLQVLANTDGENAKLSLIGRTAAGGVGTAAICRIEAESKQSSNSASEMQFKTRTTGNVVTTAMTIDENQHINFPIDGQKLKLGAGADLQIYHDGADDHIDSGSTNSMIIASKYLRVMNQAANETMAKFIENAQVELFYDNVKKAETYASGLIAHHHLKVMGGQDQNAVIQMFADEGDNTDDQFLMVSEHNPNRWALLGQYVNGWHRYIQVLPQNGVQLYYDELDSTSPAAKLVTTSYGVGIGGDINLLDNGTIYGGDDAANTLILRSASGNANHSRIDIGVSEGSDNGGIHFYTAGSSAATRAMTIKGTSQKVLIGMSSPSITSPNNPRLQVQDQLGIMAPNNSDSQTAIVFQNPSGRQGFINTNSTSISVHGTSDYRVKQDINYSIDATSIIKEVKPCTFKFKADTSKTVHGFIAHELQEVLPEAVAGEKDEVVTQAKIDAGEYTQEALGDEVHQGVDPTKLIPLLTKALQEAIVKIETLETKVAALEAA